MQIYHDSYYGYLQNLFNVIIKKSPLDLLISLKIKTTNLYIFKNLTFLFYDTNRLQKIRTTLDVFFKIQ